MIDGSTLVGLAFAYVGVLFLIAWIGDRLPARAQAGKGRPIIYALSIAVYCTSWTFFGSVGLAASSGYDFVPVYLGAIVCFLFCTPLIQRIVRLARNQNITSVADFLAARHGKSQSVAAVVAVIAVISALPYIALQLKAVALSVDTVLGARAVTSLALPVDTALIVAAAMALFATLFGTRHADATEHQHGLMLAIAAESIVKLAAFLAVGAFVVILALGSMPDGVGPAVTSLMARARANPQIEALFARGFNGSAWLTVSVLSFVAILLLPRQFHVVVVENTSEAEIKRAAWLFPLYLVLINLFVIPIAVIGLITLPAGSFAPDTFVLALPLTAGSGLMTMVAFIGGLSAATAMVIVDSVALAIMVCNGLAAPLLLRSRFGEDDPQANMVGRLLTIRRVAIFAIIFLGYGFYKLVGVGYGLASIGLVSFAGTAQLAPAFFIGLVWRKATARGAIAGMIAGILVWAYTLVLPWFAEAGLVDSRLLKEGPFGLTFLAPQALFYLRFDPLTHGVLWSLSVNAIAYATVSLWRQPEPVERLQANLFIADDPPRTALPPTFRRWRTSITVADLEATVGRYLGAERAQRSFKEYALSLHVPLRPDDEADVQLVRFTEHLLTSAIGAASARLVLSLLLRRGNMAPNSAMRLLDDASEALQYNRDLLQSALDQVRHGLSVFDQNMQLVCWNRQFRELLDLPPEMGRIGVPLDRVLRLCAERGDLGAGRIEDLVSDRLVKLAVRQETFVEHFQQGRRIIEIRTAGMPQGGIVTTYADITDRMAAADALARSNETLERRVTARTTELSAANTALAAAKAQADTANQDKTRFLAAASHDILQPLNAARLYASSLVERQDPSSDPIIAGKIDQSLNAVEEILGTLIEIARLDTSRMDAELTALPVEEIFERLRVEFEPQARERGLDLRIVPSSLWITSDRRLLPRLMQNFVSNAIKYTRTGGVVIGARRSQRGVELQVWDSGPGIAADQHERIFKEFQRLEATAGGVHGLGLGLSIVERISKVLDHRIGMVSRPGVGSMFSVTTPRAPAGARRREANSASATLAARLGGLTVLCIDNDAAILEGMRTLLSGWQCTVTTADSTAEALAALKTMPQRPDIVLADYHLDGETGLDAIAAVRAAVGHPIPALVITADNSAELQRQLREAGHGLLRKPVKVAALRAALMQANVQLSAAAE
jgi:Na+/proline symporter/signal transduction histidine kinase/ActR/RegA family two-component response regulator